MAPPPPGFVGRLLRRLPWLTDAIVGTVYGCVAVLLATISAYPPLRTPLWFTLALLAGGIVVVTLRRRYPVPTFIAALALFVLSALAGTGAESIVAVVTIFTVGALRSTAVAWAGFALATGVGCLAAVILVLRGRDGLPLWEPTQLAVTADPVNDWFNAAILILVPFLVAALMGVNAGQRRRYVDTLVDRAAQLERERDQQAEIASAAERERISREMHDVMAHSVSVMVALSEGARATVTERPAESSEVMSRVAETGRRTLAELRRLLGAVPEAADSTSPAHSPQPDASHVPDLAADFRHAGLPVELTVEGTPAADPALGLTVFRIVQEALTNALRHAEGATEVTATITWSSEDVTIVVLDDAPHSARTSPAGASAEARQTAATTGRGLVGIRERVALYGGSVESGPAEGRGWRVAARLRWAEEQR
ncbi:histidine kinase [Marisediminicola sp. LYQ134]|uniref:sensor histidine kinase n=1 Tax=Marisediminicola sp. LYQ134 TaxID=3391061 RepID=UPI0039838711